MDEQKKKRLEAAGWKFGTVAELLKLTVREAELVEAKLRMHRELTRLPTNRKTRRRKEDS